MLTLSAKQLEWETRIWTHAYLFALSTRHANPGQQAQKQLDGWRKDEAIARPQGRKVVRLRPPSLGPEAPFPKLRPDGSVNASD